MQITDSMLRATTDTLRQLTKGNNVDIVTVLDITKSYASRVVKMNAHLQIVKRLVWG